MKNFEKYEKEIVDIVNQGRGFGLCDEKIMECATMNCEQCEFYWMSCSISRIRWLYAEYTKPKPTITTKEKDFLEMVDKKSESYITRDENGGLFFHMSRPEKIAKEWISDELFIELKSTSFPFIKWEDDEPWSVEELLELEVEDER